MLSDAQIDRYSRQIVLSEIGGAGQERLLRAEVAIEGGGDAALVCASYLAGAGVGTLSIGGIGLRNGNGLGDALDLETRNADCRLVRAPRRPSVMIVVGREVPPGFPSGSAVVWGAASGDWLRRAYLPPGRACAPCLQELARRQPDEEGSPQILGALLALEALRALLEISAGERASLVEIDVGRAVCRSLPFPARPGCSLCQ